MMGSPKPFRAQRPFTVTKVQDPNAVIVKIRNISELHVEAKFFNALRQGIKEQLDVKVFKHDRSLGALPLAYSQVKEVGATRIIGDNPQLHVPLQVTWTVFRPQLGIKLEATVVSQSDFEGLRLLLELQYLNSETNSNASHAVNVLVSRDRVGKVCTWAHGSFARRKSKYTHIPELVRIGCKLSFWVIGHTCDPDGGNYALHGTLYEKDLKKLSRK